MGLTPRVYETIYQGFSSKVNQPRSVMSTCFSSNQNEARDKTLDSQNLNSQYWYNLPRAQSTIYHQSENSPIPYSQSNLFGSAEHYTHYFYQDQQTRPPIGTHILNRQLPPFTKAPVVTLPRTSKPQTARVHFEDHHSVDSEPLTNLKRTSRIETSQSCIFLEQNRVFSEKQIFSFRVPQSAGEANTQPAVNRFSSSQIRYPQSSINQQNSSGLEEARRYPPQPPAVKNARSSLTGHGPQQGVDGSLGFYPPNVDDQWPYPPVFPPSGYYSMMPYGPAYGQPGLPFDFCSTSQNDP